MKETKEEEDHKMSDADKYQQFACTHPNRPIIHQESGDKLYGTDTANYGHLGVVPRLKSRKSFIKRTGLINTMAKAAGMELWRERLAPLDVNVHLNISADEPPSWRRESMDNLEGTKRIRQTMQLLLVCPMTDTVCSPHDLTTANGIAIDYAKHCEDTI